MLSDVQYRELVTEVYADPVKTLGEHAWGNCNFLGSIFINYLNIKDIVSCSLVNREWKQLLSNDPRILFSLCGRPPHLNSGFKLQPAFFSNNIRNNSNLMLDFIILNRIHEAAESCFPSVEFLGDQLDQEFFIKAVKILGARVLPKIPHHYFHDVNFLMKMFIGQ